MHPSSRGWGALGDARATSVRPAGGSARLPAGNPCVRALPSSRFARRPSAGIEQRPNNPHAPPAREGSHVPRVARKGDSRSSDQRRLPVRDRPRRVSPKSVK